MIKMPKNPRRYLKTDYRKQMFNINGGRKFPPERVAWVASNPFPRFPADFSCANSEIAPSSQRCDSVIFFTDDP